VTQDAVVMRTPPLASKLMLGPSLAPSAKLIQQFSVSLPSCDLLLALRVTSGLIHHRFRNDFRLLYSGLVEQTVGIARNSSLPEIPASLMPVFVEMT